MYIWYRSKKWMKVPEKAKASLKVCKSLSSEFEVSLESGKGKRAKLTLWLYWVGDLIPELIEELELDSLGSETRDLEVAQEAFRWWM